MLTPALTAFNEDELDVEFDLDNGSMTHMMPDGVQIEMGDESAVVDFAPVQGVPAGHVDHDDFNVNLVEVLDENELTKIANDLLEDIEEDKTSREDWEARLAKGMTMMGVTDDKGKRPFPGASSVVHPVLGEAIVQFQSRGIAELFPAAGPVKGKVLGEADEEVDGRRERGTDYMNYQYTEEMPEAFWEMDMLLFRLPLEGSAFKKSWMDPAKKRVCQGFVPAEDLIVPYTASNLEDAPRHTHILRYYTNDMRRRMASGFYRKVDLDEPMDDAAREVIEETIDDSEGRSPTDLRTDRRHMVYECNTEYAIEGLGDDPDAVMPPYLISIEVESRKVLAIYRNWKKDDGEDKKRRVFFTHYKYLPGFGFYGFGLLHMIGGLSEAATGALRALMDSAQLSNMRGGFKSKDSKVSGGEMSFAPGEWKDVDVTADDIRKTFMPIEYKEPSITLFNLLGFLVEAAQRFAGTTEAMVGDADNKGPVGTTIALIEQGSKVFSAIHKRLHRAQGEEFRLVADLNYESLEPGVEYPYMVAGEQRHIMQEDFDGRVDWVPVSDPNIFSATQRIAQAQAVLQLSKDSPELYNQHEANRRMLEALRVDDIERLLPETDEVERMDPVTEGMALLHGKGIRVFQDQDHKAHMMVHEAWFGSLPPQAQKAMQGQHMAHIGEHLAWDYRTKIEGIAGGPMPYHPDFHAENGEDMMPELPPEVENQIAALAAQASQALAAEQDQQGPPPDPRVIEAQAKVKREDAVAMKEQERKDAELQIKGDQVSQAIVLKRGEIEAKLGMEGEKLAITLEQQVDQFEAEIATKRAAGNAESTIKRESADADAQLARDEMEREQDRKDEESAAEQARADKAQAAEAKRAAKTQGPEK